MRSTSPLCKHYMSRSRLKYAYLCSLWRMNQETGKMSEGAQIPEISSVNLQAMCMFARFLFVRRKESGPYYLNVRVTCLFGVLENNLFCISRVERLCAAPCVLCAVCCVLCAVCSVCCVLCVLCVLCAVCCVLCAVCCAAPDVLFTQLS